MSKDYLSITRTLPEEQSGLLHLSHAASPLELQKLMQHGFSTWRKANKIDNVDTTKRIVNLSECLLLPLNIFYASNHHQYK